MDVNQKAEVVSEFLLWFHGLGGSLGCPANGRLKSVASLQQILEIYKSDSENFEQEQMKKFEYCYQNDLCTVLNCKNLGFPFCDEHEK